jgi:hypothetical protein
MWSVLMAKVQREGRGGVPWPDDVANSEPVGYENEVDEQARSVVAINEEAEGHRICAEGAEAVAIREEDASLEAVRTRQVASIRAEAEVGAVWRVQETDSALVVGEPVYHESSAEVVVVVCTLVVVLLLPREL